MERVKRADSNDPIGFSSKYQ